MNEELYRLLIFRYIFIISIGTYSAYVDGQVPQIITAENTRKRKIIEAFLCIIGIVFVYMTQYAEYIPKVFRYWSGTCMLACLIIIPIENFLKNKYEWIHFKIIDEIGKASFNIFLFQMLYYSYLYLFGELELKREIYLITNILSCTVGGYIFYRIEQPITSKIIKLALTYHSNPQIG